MKIDVERLSVALIARRGKATQQTTAAEVGIGLRTYKRIELADDHYQPDFSTFVRVCKFVGVPMERFIIDERADSPAEIAA